MNNTFKLPHDFLSFQQLQRSCLLPYFWWFKRKKAGFILTSVTGSDVFPARCLDAELSRSQQLELGPSRRESGSECVCGCDLRWKNNQLRPKESTPEPAAVPEELGRPRTMLNHHPELLTGLCSRREAVGY